MSESSPLVVFRIEKQRYGLPLGIVDRIVRAAEVTLLPNAPTSVIGVLDVAGRVLPVLNIRQRLGLPEHKITPAAQLVIARTTSREVVFVIDEALGVIEQPSASIVNATRVVPGLVHIRGVAQLADGLVLIYDLEKFLSWEEERALDAALREGVTYAS